MSRKQLLIGLVALAVVAVGIVAYFVFFSDSASGSLSGNADKFGIALTSRDRTQGSPKAPILMVEYAAPTCPVCAAFDMQIFPQLKRSYIDTGKVYYVFRVFPLSSVDVAAESIARCLPPENYFSFIDLLYRNQPKWDPEYPGVDVQGGLVSMARIARPLRLSEGSSGGVLTLKAEPAASLFLQHESRALCDRINDYLGRPAVSRLRFVQGPLARRPARPALPVAPQPAAANDPARRFQGSERLRTALLELARARNRPVGD